MADEFDQTALLARAPQRFVEMARSDPQIAAMVPDPAVTSRLQSPGATYRSIVAAALSGYSDRPAYGVRDYAIGRDPTGAQVRESRPSYRLTSYAELSRQIEAVASFWQHDPLHRISPGEMVAFISFSGAEMATMDFATVYAQVVSVPLQANLAADTMTEILADTAPAALVASVDNLSLAADYALAQSSIRSVIVIDSDERVDADRAAIAAVRARLAAADRGIAFATFAEAVDAGSAQPFVPLPDPAEGRDHISMIMYTSGSTGAPKGALIHDAISIQFWSWIPVYQATVTVAYAPMNHFMGRTMVHSALAQGGTVYFTPKSDMSMLFEDIRLARPTFLLIIPRVCELIYQYYVSEVERRTAKGVARDEADAEVRCEMRRHYLGDRLVSAGVGSSPTSPEVRRFVSECFEMPFVEGYGCTEAGGGAMTSLNQVLRHVVTDYKLIDVPELGYYTTDLPHPRGELLVKTSLMFQGYFKRPDASAAMFDQDGYLKTGDIMEERAPDRLVWVDRRNNVIKLSQAEYVAIGPLEAVYLGQAPLIRQVFLYGSSYRSFLLAVVVPDLDLAALRLGHAPDDVELRSLVLAELQEAARRAGLKSFEVPRDVLIEREPFSLENGLLSSVRKPLRPALKKRYAERLEAMYEAMGAHQRAELSKLRSAGNVMRTRDRVAGALKANLGLAAVDPESPQSYGDLGGDSLGAVGLSMLLEEMFGRSVPVSTILHPDASVGRISDFIDSALAVEGRAVGFSSIHSDPDEVRAVDFSLDRLFDAATLAVAERVAPAAAQASTVLLTGANGFLGRFLALDWLEALAARGGRLICLVRGGDAEAGRARLDAAIGTADPKLAERFRDLADRHLQVIAGDLVAPRLGLSEPIFARLAEEVDQIVHPAALVNHRLSYQSLFEPNVLGSMELVRLALTKRQKRFDYVSSIAVPSLKPELMAHSEDIDVRVGVPEVMLSNAYALGYGASKWAGEVILRDAHQRYGLPVNVFRADMIMPHSRYVGQFNAPDMITRLLYSLVMTGLAPKSFYALDADGRCQPAHYDGLPVDFVAATMQQIGDRPGAGFQTFNMVNVNQDDGISLDSFVDWIHSAGYPLSRIDDHADWLLRFTDRLRALPDDERQQSSLSILDYFSQPHSVFPQAIASERFSHAVRSIASGPTVPSLTERYLHKYLDDMANAGLIKQMAIA